MITLHWLACHNYIFFFKIKNCLNDDLFISWDDRIGKMLHNICISAVAMSLRWATRGPLVYLLNSFFCYYNTWTLPSFASSRTDILFFLVYLANDLRNISQKMLRYSSLWHPSFFAFYLNLVPHPHTKEVCCFLQLSFNVWVLLLLSEALISQNQLKLWYYAIPDL